MELKIVMRRPLGWCVENASGEVIASFGLNQAGAEAYVAEAEETHKRWAADWEAERHLRLMEAGAAELY